MSLVPIVSHLETGGPQSRVPVSTADTPCPGSDVSNVQGGGDSRPDVALERSGAGHGGVLGLEAPPAGVRPELQSGGGGSVDRNGGVCLAGYTAPVTASPYDPWHSEEYLLRCLVRHHGWYWLRPRVLAGPWRRPRVRSFMHPEGE